MINLHDFKSDKPEIKYHCAKRAIAVSEKNPQTLYPQLNTFVRLLDGENNVLRWTGLIVIGNLSAADAQGRITKLVPRLLRFTKAPSLITASNAVNALGKIAAHKPRLRSKILKALLGVEKVMYYNKGKPSPECGNIVIGHLLDVFAGFDDETLKSSKQITAFVKRQTRNTRLPVRDRAVLLYRRMIAIS
ncbi:MAG: hypothetical protein PHY34_05145 [Patescibacteria group bacterium]|nr:hypothetical protein [Patescibacteria group bacterium]MDD5715762.1 hypothetical protein [Patescibacteria group bacterium]